MSELDPLIRRLQSIARLTDAQREVLSKVPFRRALLQPEQHAVSEGERPTHCCLQLSGLMFRHKITSSGGRQILAFHIPGDIPDLQSLHLETMDHSLAAVVATEVALIRHEDIEELVDRSPGIGSMLWRESLIDAAVFRAWIVAMGQLDSSGRLAHLLCEMFTRMAAVGLTEGRSCNLPLTQVELADALGVSAVHVNRTLQDLRRSKLIQFEGGRLTILDWAALVHLADFNPQYLQLRTPPVAL